MNKKERNCLNWACEKVYKEENNHPRACLTHTGRWDFGHTGQSVTKVADGVSADELMWAPHWTCCRKGWEDDGCTRMKHKGPFTENYPTEKRPFKWPDVRAQSYFQKMISGLWRDKLSQQCDYDEEKLRRLIRRASEDIGYGGVSL